jgi:hypothetical protein
MEKASVEEFKKCAAALDFVLTKSWIKSSFQINMFSTRSFHINFDLVGGASKVFHVACKKFLLFDRKNTRKKWAWNLIKVEVCSKMEASCKFHSSRKLFYLFFVIWERGKFENFTLSRRFHSVEVESFAANLHNSLVGLWKSSQIYGLN